MAPRALLWHAAAGTPLSTPVGSDNVARRSRHRMVTLNHSPALLVPSYLHVRPRHGTSDFLPCQIWSTMDVYDKDSTITFDLTALLPSQ